MLSETGWVVVSRVEVAAMLGISREAVFQAERRALTKLRMALLPILRFHNPALAIEMEGRALLHRGVGRPRVNGAEPLSTAQRKRQAINAAQYKKRKAMKYEAQQFELLKTSSAPPELQSARLALTREIDKARKWAMMCEDSEHLLNILDTDLPRVARGIGDWGCDNYRQLRDAILTVQRLERAAVGKDL